MLKSRKLRIIFSSFMVCAFACLILVSGGLRASSNRIVGDAKSTAPSKSLAASGPRSGQSIEDIKSRFPKVDYDAPEPADPSEKTKRRNKSKHFDKLGGVSKEPTHYSAGLRNHWDINVPAFPVAQSNAVLIAQTIARGAFLSNDKGAVYTELSVKVEDVLQGNSDLLTKASRIDINRLGGVVHYRTGEESLFFINGQNMPNVGKRYLFFLKAITDSQDFQIITGYELGPSGVTALDSPPQFTQYNGTDVSVFLNAVRKTIAEQKQ